MNKMNSKEIETIKAKQILELENITTEELIKHFKIRLTMQKKELMI